MVPVALRVVAPSNTPFSGSLRVTVKVSSGSSRASSASFTRMVAAVAPGANSTVPRASVKSRPAAALPDAVFQEARTVRSRSGPLRVTGNSTAPACSAAAASSMSMERSSSLLRMRTTARFELLPGGVMRSRWS